MKRDSLYREQWADYAKGIGILLVFLGHSALENQAVLRFINAFHMPLFFIISGYFASVKSDFPEYFRKNFRTLILPYLSFYILTLPFGYYKIFTDNQGWQTSDFIEMSRLLINGALLVESRIGISYMNNPSLWFFVALFGVKMLFYLHNRLIKSNQWYCVLSLVCLLVLFVFHSYGIYSYFRINSILLTYPFFIVGYLLKQRNIIINLKQISAYYRILLAFLAFFICYYISEVNGSIQVSTANYGNSLLMTFVGGITGTMGVILFSISICKFTLLSCIGYNSAVLFGLHTPFHAFLRSVFSTVFGYSIKACPIIYGLMMTFILTIVLLPISFLINKYCPWIIGKTKANETKN